MCSRTTASRRARRSLDIARLVAQRALPPKSDGRNFPCGGRERRARLKTMSRRQIEDDGIDAVSRRHFVRTSALLGGGLIATSSIARAAPAGAPSRGPYFDVRDFGAIGDGKTDDTRALQRGLDATHQAGGGIVQVPAGTWLSGGLQLHSRLTLDLAPGATLLASPEGDDFPPYEHGHGDSDVE